MGGAGAPNCVSGGGRPAPLPAAGGGCVWVSPSRRPPVDRHAWPPPARVRPGCASHHLRYTLHGSREPVGATHAPRARPAPEWAHPQPHTPPPPAAFRRSRLSRAAPPRLTLLSSPNTPSSPLHGVRSQVPADRDEGQQRLRWCVFLEREKKEEERRSPRLAAGPTAPRPRPHPPPPPFPLSPSHLLPHPQQEAAAGQPAVEAGVLAGGPALGAPPPVHAGHQDD